MKIVITLKNGMILEFSIENQKYFDIIIKEMKGLKKIFTREIKALPAISQGKMWIRKSEITSIELIYPHENI